MNRMKSELAYASPRGIVASLDNQTQSELLADYPDLLTVGHVCELTGLSSQTVRKEINEGRLPGCRIGRRFYVPKLSFLDFVMKGGGVHDSQVTIA